MDTFARNLRHAVRALLRAPAFSLTVIVTLALGIGANSAVFSAINAVLLKPLPFPQAGQLVRLKQTSLQGVGQNVAPVRLEDWNERTATFQAMTGYLTQDVSDTSGDLPERLRLASVAPRFLGVWRPRSAAASCRPITSQAPRPSRSSATATGNGAFGPIRTSSAARCRSVPVPIRWLASCRQASRTPTRTSTSGWPP